MHTYAQKQSHPRNTGVARFARSVDSQTARRMLKSQAAENQAGSRPMEDRDFGHHFSRMAIHAPGNRVLQKKPEPPGIRISQFSASDALTFQVQNNPLQKADGDKSVTPSTEDQDQQAGSTSLKAAPNGIIIKVEPEGVYTSTDYPDGFRWTQTITTNANKGGPLLNTPVQYTDPKPNDDNKPFYWTDAEELQHKGTFEDTPTRKPRPAGTVNWDAFLSLNGVNGKHVTRFDTLTYGFSVDSTGTVTVRGPAEPADLSDHFSTLRSDFPGWQFD